MLSKDKTLKILKKEAKYEEEISKDLLKYYLNSLEEIEMNSIKKEQTKNDLKTIIKNSIKHKIIIQEIINEIKEEKIKTF